MTPAGAFPLRQVMYRPDRLQAPETGLSVRAIDPSDGWCDDPRDPRYNQLIRLPCNAGHERLWRDDGLYDLLVVIGYNDDPVGAGLGSAIFLHVAKAGYGPTEGCVALALPDLIALLRACRPGDRIVIGAGSP
jgi:L,D-peptidoglycan transpeptidase YkuD (ErfK/YbiS/YcfS/YnhG family)